MTEQTTDITKPAGKPPRHWTAWWPIRIVRLLAIAYCAATVFLYLAQRRLIFPGSLAPAAVTRIVPPTGAEPLALKTTDGSPLAGLFVRAFDKYDKPVDDPREHSTILYFYGNGSSVSSSMFEIDLFRRCGANVLTVDYPGYGMSAGIPSEQGCYDAASALWEFAQRNPRINPDRLYSVGWSLGSAVAIDLAARRPVAGLVTLSAFTSMAAMAHYQYPIFPTDLLLEHHFYSARKLPLVHCPMLLYHGDIDSQIPPRMSQALAQSARPGQAHYEPVPGAGHNEIFPVGYYQIMKGLRPMLQTP
jgi:pimeloyl-ACP methyl ester carboxylesterase